MKQLVALRVFTLLGISTLAFAVAAGGQPLLGDVEFPNSGAVEAQEPFLRGVLFLHNFEYEDAAGEFRRAQEMDPDFAMAYWGEAMTHNHPIWQAVESAQGQAALAKLAPTAEERAAKAPTQREKDYLAAVEILFSRESEKEQRDLDYLAEMRRLAARYPDDLEAASFHSLAILGSAHEGRDFSIYMRAAGIVEEVFAKNPRHPGAAHYLIHSYDDPIHAPLGLRAARVYSEIAPSAAHAQHMTSHIFVALGMWDDVVSANLRARDVQDARRAELGRHANVCGHYAAWLQYGYLQQGRFGEAADLLDLCHELVADGGTTRGEQWYFGRMRARYLLDTGDWDAAALGMLGDLSSSAVARHNYRYISALAALRGGQRATAEELAGEMAAIREGDDSTNLAIEGRQLEALLALDADDAEGALAALRAASEEEAAMPFNFGPPSVIKPSHELLGEALLNLGRAEDAREAFEAALGRAPRRTASLLGLAKAEAAAGRAAQAEELYATLRSIWSRADEMPASLPAAPSL